MASARRNLGDPHAALEILRPLAAAQPGWAPAHYELGLTLGHAGFGDEAVAALRTAVQLKPDIGRCLARCSAITIRRWATRSAADAAYANHIQVFDARSALARSRRRRWPKTGSPSPRPLLREHLKQFPTDVAAIRMLAEVAARLGRYADAENLLARCLELAPGLQRRAPQLRRGPAPAEQGRPRPSRKSTGCSRSSRATRVCAT